MFRSFDYACFYRVVMYIIHLLKCKSPALQFHRLIIPASGAGQALPPKLVILIPAVFFSLFLKKFQHPVPAAVSHRLTTTLHLFLFIEQYGQRVQTPEIL